MDSNICAPNKYDGNTCFTFEQLLDMAKAYNLYITKNNFNPNKDGLNSNLIAIKNDKKYLLKELMKRFDDVCSGNQICLTKQTFMNEIVNLMHEDILYNTFRPSGPEKSTEWLSTNDIDEVMKQYEIIVPEFKFMGAVPKNCSKVSLCSLFGKDFNKFINSGKTKIGIVFNHDSFGQPGSHWVALYLDLNKNHCYYCDSVGEKPLNEVREYIDSYKQFAEGRSGGKFTYKWNNNKYQMDGSECGVYSCNFLIRLLRNQDFDEIVTNPLSFKEINSCRNVYFSNKPSKFSPHENCDPV